MNPIHSANALHIGTAALSDALDSLGLPGSIEGLAAVHPDQFAIGPAFTVQYEPVDEDGGTVGDFLDEIPRGAVVVIDNHGRTDCTVWGGIMSRIARNSGIAGTVIHGTCRDTAAAAEAGYPLWSVSRFMRTGKDRVRVKTIQEPLVIDGVTISPDDIIVADDDGVVVIPSRRWDEIVELAAHIEEIEDRIVVAVESGATLQEARERHGYHTLQSRRSKA